VNRGNFTYVAIDTDISTETGDKFSATFRTSVGDIYSITTSITTLGYAPFRHMYGEEV